MGFEDEYGALDSAGDAGDRRERYRGSLDADGLQDAEREQLREASYEGLETEFEPFAVSRYTDPNGQWLEPVKTYRRARRKAERVEPAPDAVVADRYLRDMDTDTRRDIHDRGMAVVGAAIADTLDPDDVQSLGAAARRLVRQGVQELPGNDFVRAEAATVWDVFR